MFLGFVLFAFAVCLVYDDDGLLDYVWSFTSSLLWPSIVDGLESQFAITAFAMSYSVLNDLAEAMKVLEGKKAPNNPWMHRSSRLVSNAMVTAHSVPRTCPSFFSVQRLHGFRQVVQHVQLHVAK